MAITAASCSSVKPLFKGKNAVTPNTTDQPSPQFIDDIEINPSSQKSRRVYKDISPSSPKAATGIRKRPADVNYAGITESTHALQFKYAVPVEVPVEALTNLLFLQYLDDWYGTPYRYGGLNKKGIDCSAFSSGLLSSVFGITIPRTARDQYQRSRRINKHTLREGDLVFFNTTGGISHVGVYLANNKFVHASTASGVTISDMNESYYKNRYIGAGRVKY